MTKRKLKRSDIVFALRSAAGALLDAARRVDSSLPAHRAVKSVRNSTTVAYDYLDDVQDYVMEYERGLLANARIE